MNKLHEDTLQTLYKAAFPLGLPNSIIVTLHKDTHEKERLELLQKLAGGMTVFKVLGSIWKEMNGNVSFTLVISYI